jgi:hypothetical protein
MQGRSSWNLNIPQFVVVNLEKKTLSTTKASGENRSTPIRSVQRKRARSFSRDWKADGHTAF